MVFKMAIVKSNFIPRLEGNILFINDIPSLKAADSRGIIVLENIEKMLKDQEFQQVSLKYEEQTQSWVDAQYRHVIFNLNSDLAKPVVSEYLSPETPMAQQTQVGNLDYALGTDGGIAITSADNNLVNANEVKRRTTTVKEKPAT